MRLSNVPLTFGEACGFVDANHRHLKAPRGHKFSFGVADEHGQLRGVACVGRPSARGLDHRTTVEVTRVATDGARNACSKLYGAAWRIARELGYTKAVTYTRKDEPGTSLRAAGWKPVAEVKGRSWSCTSRPRADDHEIVDRIRWEIAA